MLWQIEVDLTTMRSFVIYTPGDPISDQLATRCIESGKKFDLSIERAEGFPKLQARKYAIEHGLQFGFDYLEYQKIRPLRDSQIAIFIAHRNLWSRCVALNEPINIFEHDAFLVAPIQKIDFNHVMNYQRQLWDDPNWIWHAKLQRLVDQEKKSGTAKYICLPSSAAYSITPSGAQKLLDIKNMLPLDLFVNKTIVEIDDYPLPWPISRSNDYSNNK